MPQGLRRGELTLHAGDVVFGWMYPLIDFGAGGNVDGMVAAVDRILERVDEKTRIVMGHGPVADREYLRTYRAMLATVADRVREAIANGKTLEEAQAAKLTAEFDEAWGAGFDPDTFVKMVYSSLVSE